MARRRKPPRPKARSKPSAAKKRKATGHPARPEGRRVKYRAKSKPPTRRPVAQKRTAARKPGVAKKQKAGLGEPRPGRARQGAARQGKARSLAANRGWQTRKDRAKARSAAAVRGWHTRRAKQRILFDNELRREVWEQEKKRAADIDDFVDAIVDDYDVSEHDAYSLYYSPELAA